MRMSTVVQPNGPDPDAGESGARHWLMRRVTCPNPFYLLSAACVIHATGVPLNSYADALLPETLLAIVGGYAALLAAVAFVIVRFWKVWDDARSIFMILLLLFLEMALCADGLVQADPQRAARLLAVGFAVAVGVSEFLLHSLRLRLPALFRIPYYLQLALLFLYPVVLLPSLQTHNGDATTWGIFAFPFLIGLTGLSLWPAMRRGPDAVRENGSPWVWGWYPWTLFVFLGFCLCLRSYTLCLSFDAATALDAAAAYRLENIFGLYFLTPVLFAAAVLVLEAGIQSSRRAVQAVAMWLPVLIVGLSFPGVGRNAADAEFIARLLEYRRLSRVVVVDSGLRVLWRRRVTRSARRAALGCLQYGCAGGCRSRVNRRLEYAQRDPTLAAVRGGAAVGCCRISFAAQRRDVRSARIRRSRCHQARLGRITAGSPGDCHRSRGVALGAHDRRAAG